MEKAIIAALLEKYWQAETTVEEEQALAAYFSGPGVDAGLEVYSNLFAYFEEEAQVTASADLGERILQRIGASEDRIAPGGEVRKPGFFRIGLLSAAAAILVLVISTYLLTPAPDKGVTQAMPDTTQAMAVKGKASIGDTYDDPEKALAVVRHALLIASTHLNEGRQQLTGSK